MTIYVDQFVLHHLNPFDIKKNQIIYFNSLLYHKIKPTCLAGNVNGLGGGFPLLGVGDKSTGTPSGTEPISKLILLLRDDRDKLFECFVYRSSTDSSWLLLLAINGPGLIGDVEQLLPSKTGAVSNNDGFVLRIGDVWLDEHDSVRSAVVCMNRTFVLALCKI